jgi:tRNA G46 methylase TrmB
LQTLSRQISSNQTHLHPKLAAVVRRHLGKPARKPLAPHNLAAFELLRAELCSAPRPLVLDSFCGTGHSTAALAQRHPQHLVVGLDKSAHRLARHREGTGNHYLLLQAECEDLWQLLLEAGIGVDYHYLLYPNPWPKAKHLQRRVHGNASFPSLVKLAVMGAPGCVELRSNWQTYVEEFGVAMHLAGLPGHISRVPTQQPLSLFEKKYGDSGHDLWAFTGVVRKRSGQPVTKQSI